MPQTKSPNPRQTPEAVWEAEEALGAGRRNDARSVPELFAATMKGQDDDDLAWSAVVSLRLRATPEVLATALDLRGAADPASRARGLDVLAQFGVGKPDAERPCGETCVSLAIEALNDESPQVVQAAAWTLAHWGGDRATSFLIEMVHNPDPDVRLAVAFGVGSNPRGTATLLQLTTDETDEVRNWAMFALGSLTETDSPEIREALHRGLKDPCTDVQDEALWGLARRKDPSALLALLRRLQAATWLAGDEYAASATLGLKQSASADELSAGLRRLLGDGYD